MYIYIYKSFFIYVRAASLQEKTAIRPSIVVFVQALDVTREDKQPTEAVAIIFCINYRHLCLMGQELQRQVLVILAAMTGLTSSGSWQPCSSSPNSHQPFQQYPWILLVRRLYINTRTFIRLKQVICTWSNSSGIGPPNFKTSGSFLSVPRLPSSPPTFQPSFQPAFQPSSLAAFQPSSLPAFQPSSLPALQPSSLPALQPSSPSALQPSSLPALAALQPSLLPAFQPSTFQPPSLPDLQAPQPSSALAFQLPAYQQPSRPPALKPSSLPALGWMVELEGRAGRLEG